MILKFHTSFFLLLSFQLFSNQCSSKPWNNYRMPNKQFVELFLMPLPNFLWLVEEIHLDIVQDSLGCGQPLSFKAQVCVSQYRVANGSSYISISHIFMIAKETAYKASRNFVNAILNKFRFHTIKTGPKLFSNVFWMAMANSAMSVCPINFCLIRCLTHAFSSQISGGGNPSMHDSHLFRWFLLGQSVLGGTCPSDNSSPQFLAFGQLKKFVHILLHSQKASPVWARHKTFSCIIIHNLLNWCGSLYLIGCDAGKIKEQWYHKLPVKPTDSECLLWTAGPLLNLQLFMASLVTCIVETGGRVEGWDEVYFLGELDLVLYWMDQSF
ncbi:hypothetical protein VP01_1684g1 [Puccinia sorghi]|uniref:Uncharacterized protein n=1 Tax=Puccinia sorghi TaxID=27349 RepID=A0A0L6VHS5_9BASI|nr:hypothetical protein VP01_1684g1 [Puccinia sorghi]